MNKTTRTPRKSISARDRVSAAARALFVKNGYEGVSIDEIARKARVSKPTLYAHFGSKERLFLTILEEAFDRIAAPLLRDEVEGVAIEDVFDSHAKAYARAVLNPDMLAFNRLLIGEAVRFPEMAHQYYESGPAAAYAAVAEFLEKRVKSGEIGCKDCLAAARMYGAMIISPHRLRLQLLVDDAPNWDEIDRQTSLAVQIFVAGLKTLAAGPARALS
ncbi:TetR/AcrR family transcriptional regulator [Ensifer sp. ENS05]|uniref:TetR/AcrR family transcriptional regulator n=1 Tax=Ensifer sp. ENS05 TaxID=2769277 RepID=UPI00177CF0C3|nr:TetR/AcrR family transcriptional regulator [Ensifer sp. ENS05]MBD9596896.1 TetR/AcrR family transcriptional regulator [Ensifer sp. ENS05]